MADFVNEIKIKYISGEITKIEAIKELRTLVGGGDLLTSKQTVESWEDDMTCYWKPGIYMTTVNFANFLSGQEFFVSGFKPCGYSFKKVTFGRTADSDVNVLERDQIESGVRETGSCWILCPGYFVIEDKNHCFGQDFMLLLLKLLKK